MSQRQSIGIFDAIGQTLSVATNIIVKSGTVIDTSLDATNNLADAARLHSEVVKTKAEGKHVEAMKELQAAMA